jgi:co-chaperonin GroES (HSP10)
MQIKPQQEWLIISTQKMEKISKGGIILPELEDKNAQKLLVGKVIAAGPGKEIECTDGSIVVKPMKIKIGDIVMYSKYSKGTIENDSDKQELNNVKESDVVALIE